MNRVLGKVAIVTGSGSGLGRAEAMMFAREGAKVAVTDINDKNGMETVALIRQEGGEAEYWHLNVSVEKECADVLAKVVMAAMLLTTLLSARVGIMTKHAIQYMRKNGKGAIVNTSSVSGIIGDTELTPYHATKGTVVIMTMKDAIQYAPDHIRVNCVCPGTVMTPLVKGLLADDPHYLDNDIKRYLLGYFGEPDDVAYGVLFLASDEGRFVTGTKLVIDGGYTAQ